MKFALRCALCALTLITVSEAVTAETIKPLESRLDGQAVYDPNSNLTWLADADANNGAMTWQAAKDWAAGLTIGGKSDWRLPTTAQPDSGCSLKDAFGQDYGYNCTGSEMGNLFYNVLGGEAETSIATTHNANFDLFSNVQPLYWSATEYAPFTNDAWGFSMDDGSQGFGGKTAPLYAWAVRSGDVSDVPVPAAVWLFGSGLLGLFGLNRRRSANV